MSTYAPIAVQHMPRVDPGSEPCSTDNILVIVSFLLGTHLVLLFLAPAATEVWPGGTFKRLNVLHSERLHDAAAATLMLLLKLSSAHVE